MFQVIGRYVVLWRWGVCILIFVLYPYTQPLTLFLLFFLTGPSVLLLLEIAWLRLVAEKKYHEIRLYLVEVTADLPVRLMLMVINPCVQWKLLAMGRSVVQKLQSKQRILWWNLSQFLLPFLWEIQGFFLGNTEYIPLHLFYFFWS